MVPNVPGSYNISRKEAAQRLKVSVRTLDRYIDKRIITSKNIAGRILLNEEELVGFAKQSRTHAGIHKKARAQTIRIDRIEHAPEAEPTQKEQVHESDLVSSIEDRIYKKLYDELKEDVKNFQQRLEGANYRVGQMESQLKASVPLIEHQKLLTGHKKEIFNKRILYITLGIILIFQPIWIILAYF